VQKGIISVYEERMAQGKNPLRLEGNLGALEGTEASAVGGGTTTTTATTATTTITAETATATTTTATTTVTTETATATASTTTTTESTTLRALGLLSSIVQAAGATSELSTVPGNGSLGLIDRTELDVTETLGLTGLAVSGETDRDDLSALGKGTTEIVLGSVERQVSDEEGVGSLTLGGVVEGLGTSLLLGAGLGEVDTDGATVNLLAGKGQSSVGTLSVGELDVSETLGALGVAVGDDTDIKDLTALGELGAEPVVIDVPGETTDKDGSRGSGGSLILGLGLLPNIIAKLASHFLN